VQRTLQKTQLDFYHASGRDDIVTTGSNPEIDHIKAVTYSKLKHHVIEGCVDCKRDCSLCVILNPEADVYHSDRSI